MIIQHNEASDQDRAQPVISETLKIPVAVSTFHRGKLPKSSNRWRAFNRSFTECTMDADGLAAIVQDGYAFAPVCKGSRATKNFSVAQHLCVDFDTDDERSSLNYLERNVFIARYATVLHTTASHTPASPRGRVIFFLDQPVTDANRYCQLVAAVAAQFDEADLTCVDPTRLWFGAPGCDVVCRPQRVLPLADVEALLSDEPESGPAVDARATDLPVLGEVEELVERAIRAAKVGTRNTTGFRLFCALRQRGLCKDSAESFARCYQQAVAKGPHVYSWSEAANSLTSAYARKPGHTLAYLEHVCAHFEHVAWGGRRI